MREGKAVSWCKLSDIAVINKNKTRYNVNQIKKLHKDGNPIRVFGAGQTYADLDYSDIPSNEVITTPSIIIKSKGNISVAYYDKPFSHTKSIFSYTVITTKLVPKFIYYYLEDNLHQLKNMINIHLTIPSIKSCGVGNIDIPIPPLEEQARIVSILDRFDTLVNDLSQGLPAEITARQKQYTYYRNQLLTFDDGVEWKALGELLETKLRSEIDAIVQDLEQGRQ